MRVSVSFADLETRVSSANQRRLAGARLTEDRQLEPADLLRLLFVLRAELIVGRGGRRVTVSGEGMCG
jgi:hypothetical protein